jgi:hypothetical protein
LRLGDRSGHNMILAQRSGWGVDEVEAEAVGAGVIGLAAARASALAGR